MKSLKGLAPSIQRILAMPTELLIEHFCIIQLKASTLSSTQRKRVQARVKYLVDNNKVSQEEVENAFKQVTKMITNENNITDNSTTIEPLGISVSVSKDN